jgi:LytS/YehU family sensor histidine kinase
MITYIENAFKHGVNPDKHSEIKIAISVLENELSLLVYNRKVNTSNDEYEIGIGEKNTRERLELLYKNKYKLLRADEVDSYTVKLKILLT